MKQTVTSPSRIEVSVVPSGDKSISHRAILLNAIANGEAHISNFCVGDDRSSMLRCLRGLNVEIKQHDFCSKHGGEECFVVQGRGIDGLQEPSTILDAGNSGTTLRLVAGLLAAIPGYSVITGDRSLRSRPMDRIIDPLRKMGATVLGRSNDSLPPIAIRGGRLQGIDYHLPVASAQIKSCILIAGINADGTTSVHQPAPSRDHTERMLEAMGASIDCEGLTIRIKRQKLNSVNIRVPGDISSAAFWIVAGCCHPNASIKISGVGINKTRTGILDVLKSMGARISMENIREDNGELSADIIAESSELQCVDISGETIPIVIDELPVLALAAAAARGVTRIENAGELRVKESDRIKATVDGLSRMGARIEETEQGMIIHGGRRLKGAECSSFGDHRIAMTLGIAGLLAKGQTTISQAEAVNASYPIFWDTISKLTGSK